MRAWISVILIGVVPMLVGCRAADNCGCDNQREVRLTLPAASQRAELATALLFDRRPGRYNASAFTARSDWPSTIGFYSLGQAVYFTERFIDRQGPGFDGWDHATYRRFDSYRVGVGYK